MTRADMDAVRDEFVAAARRRGRGRLRPARAALAHGYLLSSFLSPLTNSRDDEYGGARPARALPARGLRGCARCGRRRGRCRCGSRATDWVAGGFDGEDAVAFARAAGARRAATSSTSRPARFARPAARLRAHLPDAVRRPDPPRGRHPDDRGRRDLQHDDVNTIILAGRADLCALARPHLFDPHWTLHAAAEQGYDVDWAAAVPLRAPRAARAARTMRRDAAAALRRGAGVRHASSWRRAASAGSASAIIDARSRAHGRTTVVALVAARTCDVSDEARGGARASGASGAVDMLVNNAGVTDSAALEAHDARASGERLIAVNLTGAFLCTREVLPAMRAAVAAASSTSPRRPSYAARGTRRRTARPSTASSGLTRALAAEARARGVTVNARLPGLRAHRR